MPKVSPLGERRGVEVGFDLRHASERAPKLEPISVTSRRGSNSNRLRRASDRRVTLPGSKRALAFRGSFLVTTG